jgi:hypothetical protein
MLSAILAVGGRRDHLAKRPFTLSRAKLSDKHVSPVTDLPPENGRPDRLHFNLSNTTPST